MQDNDQKFIELEEKREGIKNREKRKIKHGK